MRRPTPQPRYVPPKVGDYIAHSHQPFADFQYEAYVALKTGTFTEQRVAACATLEGAKRLAKLLNDTRDLAACWRDISCSPMYLNGSAEHWARTVIASTVCKVLDINAAHDFGASMLGRPVIGAAPTPQVDIWDVAAGVWHARNTDLREALGDDTDELQALTSQIERDGFAMFGGGAAPLFKITKAARVAAGQDLRRA